MRFITTTFLIGAVSSQAAAAANGPQYAFETVQLTLDDVGNFSDIRPAATGKPRCIKSECRAFPGTDEWPKEKEWQRLNATLGGALLKPVPAGAVCYPGPYQDAAKCSALVNSQVITKGHFDDPLGISTQWTADHPCPVVQNPSGECVQGGFPTYVVNATSVKQIQIAVNFARNRNVRLVVKNTGHDFVGRSIGAGSLAVWTHHLKGFNLIPSFTSGEFTGRAAHVGSSLEAWEVHAAMSEHGVDLVAPSFSTVGAFGGYMLGGGHSTLTSYHGLASDQVLSLNLVTADGSFVTASPATNPDLFFALRGGSGGGPFGIVTSAVVKVHDPVNITSVDLAISTLDLSNDIELFWTALSTYFIFERTIVDAGGIDRTYIYPLTINNQPVYNFTTKLEFPSKSAAEVLSLIQPLLSSLSSIGITLPTPTPKTAPWAVQVLGEGAPLRDQRFASRLIPRAVWDSPANYTAAMAALRTIVQEGGYEFHGTGMAPTLQRAGYPGNTSSANPAFRGAVMHFVVYDSFKNGPGIAGDVDMAARRRLSEYTDYIRRATAVGGGSYMNEGDVLEPGWQGSFFGGLYGELSVVKRRWDPWGLFWAPGAVGSERWEVRTADWKPHQNGRMCRVRAASPVGRIDDIPSSCR